MSDQATACPKCGAPASVVCHECGAQVAATAKSCPNCGAPVASSAQSAAPQQPAAPQQAGGNQLNNIVQGFVASMKSVFTQYATFTGRAARPEYWYFFLFNILLYVILVLPNAMRSSYYYYNSGPSIFVYLYWLYSLVALVPGIAVGVRRLHDIGKSGWYLLVSLIPIVGVILMIVWTIRESDGDNEYGPRPQ